ncbi:unnamed protein product [Didymodactylos carnosus]|uniref:Uncharacterized protein n=1 Tax=Didymodactylos carnosus TaxID=1234261 RepID=A0A814S209_9BILA|nr:unnamed protein product [Didymodactylos carnosus]CAF3905674.1 unnamed protein product [Didymodactylos carnosus]
MNIFIIFLYLINMATSVDSKEIKLQLKQARELINRKDHAAALKLCENIIVQDKKNYMAWVMIAACAQELKQFNQAQCALFKALELDENQTFAYQGMISLYEKCPALLTEEDLISSYRKLCMLTRAYVFSLPKANVLY